MEPYKREFIEFMVRSGVLTFGDFTTKSGRRTPYFINTGRYRTGEQLHQLGRFYALALRARLGEGFDVLFGPAYKGIPLVTATAIVLHTEYGQEVGYCFNRKEVKDHGEGGAMVGHVLRDGERVVFVEDVTTAGTSIRETVPLLLSAADVQLSGLVVSVDRMERGRGEISALRELSEEFGFPAFAIVTIDEVVELLEETEIDGRRLLDPETLERIGDYRRTYGAS